MAELRRSAPVHDSQGDSTATPNNRGLHDNLRYDGRRIRHAVSTVAYSL
jgi:hypothetical protein